MLLVQPAPRRRRMECGSERSPYYTSAMKELPSTEKFTGDVAKIVADTEAAAGRARGRRRLSRPRAVSPGRRQRCLSRHDRPKSLGRRPKPGDSARTVGDFAASYKSRVLPAFMSVIDDPTMKMFDGKSSSAVTSG